MEQNKEQMQEKGYPPFLLHSFLQDKLIFPKTVILSQFLSFRTGTAALLWAVL